MKHKILLFLKGVLMGICDLIPGISGGTIAFITGIYARLVNAVKSFSPGLLYSFLAYIIKRDNHSLNKLKQNIRKLDLGFLIILILGILTAILLGSRIIKFLLDNYFAFTLAFFIGLILASSKIIFNNIKNHKIKNLIFGIIGFIIGIYLSALIPANPSITFPYVFLGGFVAVSAMFLPGISGSFILLIMGLYEFMINVLQNLLDNIKYLLVFILGTILGIFTISRIVSFFFKKDKCKTLYVLLGLVLGSLSVPIKKIIQSTSFNPINTFIMLILMILGVLFVVIIDIYSTKKEKVIGI